MELVKEKLYFAVSSERRLHPDQFPNKSINLDDHYSWNERQRYTPPSIRSILLHCAEVERRKRKFDAIVYLTNDESDVHSIQKRTHSALFMGAYAVLNLDWSTKYTMHILNQYIGNSFAYFCDHSGSEKYRLSIFDCLEAIKFAIIAYGWFTTKIGAPIPKGVDMNWIIPNKIIAMRDPKKKCQNQTIGVNRKYKSVLVKHSIDRVIRLNDKDFDLNEKYGQKYPLEEFIAAGISHIDMFIKDGGIPSWKQVDSFLSLCSIKGMKTAVHCHAGLGRTGTMIACYLIHEYEFTSRQAVAWLNLCRRGSIMGKQHQFLDNFYQNLEHFNSCTVAELYMLHEKSDAKLQERINRSKEKRRKTAKKDEDEPVEKKEKISSEKQIPSKTKSVPWDI